jgi:hypothetical protein
VEDQELVRKKSLIELRPAAWYELGVTTSFALHQLTHPVSEFLERKNHVTELLAVGKMEQSRHHFAAALPNFEEAARLSKDDLQVLRALGRPPCGGSETLLSIHGRVGRHRGVERKVSSQ